VRFEHCYRVDEERQIPIADKRQCWREWAHRYSYGQSRDRIGYAMARERTLAEAQAAGAQSAPRGAAGMPPHPLPQPTNAFAPPPPTLRPASAAEDGGATSESSGAAREVAAADAGIRAGGALAAATSVAVPDAPGASCAGACGNTWSSCKQQCKAAACRTECDEHYRGCMRACF
jgi:hypothetical protein